jgi:hypothetical protein
MVRFVGKTDKMITECIKDILFSKEDLNIFFPVITLQRGNIIKNKILHYLNEMNINWTIDNNTICIFIGDNIHKIIIDKCDDRTLRGSAYDVSYMNINYIEYINFELLKCMRNPHSKLNYINIYED